jgi:hypothetical protein
MLGDQAVVTVEPVSEKKAYKTPILTTHGSVAELTRHESDGGHSGLSVSSGAHHKYRWWEHLF